MIDVEWYKEENKVSYQTDIEINSMIELDY